MDNEREYIIYIRGRIETSKKNHEQMYTKQSIETELRRIRSLDVKTRFVLIY